MSPLETGGKFARCCLVAVALGACVVGAAEVTTRSTFHCLSLYWPRASAGPCTVEYRVAGATEWQRAQDLWYDGETGSRMMHQYRGSIVGLQPGTAYDVRLEAGGERQVVSAATWREEFKIRKTICVGSGAATFETTEGGSEAEGYVLYDATGATIDAADRVANCLRVEHSYVIVRGLTARNAQRDALVVAPGLTDVVIEECDVSGWGALRKVADNTRWGLQDAGIKCGSTNRRMIIQRNRVHDPRYTSTLWDEEAADHHPRGPRAVFLGHRSDDEDWEANHVIRYNEITSDPAHLFEDAVGGGLNFSQTGHPGQDSDIYGNVIAHAADDLIEADGGGMNVRIWGNYLDFGAVFVSLQSCTLGPTYVFRNVMARGTQFELRHKPWSCGLKLVGNIGSATATAARSAPFRGRVYFFHNTQLYPEQFRYAFSIHPDDDIRNVVSRNNIFQTADNYLKDGYTAGKSRHKDRPEFNPSYVNCSFDYDLRNHDSAGDSVTTAVGSHGIKAEARWRDGHGPTAGASGRYQLAADAAGRNAGVALDNFNRGARDEGGAPDMGAQEFDAPPLGFGLKAGMPR